MAKETFIAWMWLALFRLVLSLIVGWYLLQKLLTLFRNATSIFRMVSGSF